MVLSTFGAYVGCFMVPFGARGSSVVFMAFDAPVSLLTIPCSVAKLLTPVKLSEMLLITIVFFERGLCEVHVPDASYKTLCYARREMDMEYPCFLAFVFILSP